MFDFDSWVQPDDFKMIVVECQEILAPLAFLKFDHPIALELNLVLCDYFITRTKQLRHHKLALLRAEGIVFDAWDIFCDQVKVRQIAFGELIDVGSAKAYDTEGLFHFLSAWLISVQYSLDQGQTLVRCRYGGETFHMFISAKQRDCCPCIDSSK